MGFDFKQNFASAKTKKEQLDKTLSLYKIGYDITIEFGEEYHGNQDIHVDLKVIKN